jgi:hypothetical protein
MPLRADATLRAKKGSVDRSQQGAGGTRVRPEPLEIPTASCPLSASNATGSPTSTSRNIFAHPEFVDAKNIDEIRDADFRPLRTAGVGSRACCGERTDINQRGGLNVTATLAALETAIRASWSPDTVDEDDGWDPSNPARGHCDVTCLVVNDLLGGALLLADVYLRDERIMAHMWNRLDSGIEIDLTRDQFRDGEMLRDVVVRSRPETFDISHPRYHRYEKYLILAERVRERLAP